MDDSSGRRRLTLIWTSVVVVALVVFVLLTWPESIGKEHDFASVEPQLDTAGLAPEVLTELMTAYDDVGLHFARIEPIFDRACYDCHSDRDEYPWYYNLPVVNGIMRDHITEGREHLDFADGFPFRGRGSQRDLLHEMQEEIEEANMPLPSYLWLHPEAKIEGAVADTVLGFLENAHARIMAVYNSGGVPVEGSVEEEEHEHDH